MKNAALEGFEKNTSGNIEQLQKKINSFIEVFKQEIKENDIYNFLYIPQKGTLMYKNSKLEKTIIGLDFKKALFGIWIGKEPAQESLKKDLLNL